MKRGRDDEKVMEPMFPRLHVNDTERRGPRAPPRNKMALYELFSIPSQRLTSGVLPTGVVPPPSTSQGSDQEKGMFSPNLHHLTNPVEKSHTGFSKFKLPPTKLGQKKKLDEEDFRVPIFVQSDIGQDHSNKSNGVDRKNLCSLSLTGFGRSMKVRNPSDKEPKRTGNAVSNMRQEGKIQNKEIPKDFICGNDVSNEPLKSIANGLSSNRRRDCCQEELASPNNPTFDSIQHEDETHGSLHMGNGDRGDDASETSVLDSISGSDISPDDVVGVIGQKHFWKVRRAIVNQQRVFAVQVFELHRLIKVQRSIAGSPHLLHEGTTYLGKPLKGSPAKKLRLECITKPPPPNMKQYKDSSDYVSQKMESSAEDAVERSSLSSVQNVSDKKVSPWCFPQPPGHQWVVPVMSPSEGLIYKPYPGHGFMDPLCVPYSHPHNPSIGFPPISPLVGHGYFPAYGMPVISPVNSGSTVVQANIGSLGQQPAQLSGKGSIFNPEHQTLCNVPTQKNGAISKVGTIESALCKNGPISKVGTKESELCNNGAISNVGSKESELRASSGGSSPGEGTRGFGVGFATRGRNAISLFPVVERERTRQLHDTDQPTRVIKVVPCNAMSATESVARIFQSIQEERKRYDSV